MDNILFTDTITLFNRIGETWHKTVLKNVQWIEKQEKSSDDNGIFSIVNYVEITVPYRDGYVQNNDYKGSGFTFGVENLDFVVYGDIPEELTDSKSLSELKVKYQVYTVHGFSNNTLRPYLKHWRVIAK